MTSPTPTIDPQREQVILFARGYYCPETRALRKDAQDKWAANVKGFARPTLVEAVETQFQYINTLARLPRPPAIRAAADTRVAAERAYHDAYRLSLAYHDTRVATYLDQSNAKISEGDTLNTKADDQLQDVLRAFGVRTGDYFVLAGCLP